MLDKNNNLNDIEISNEAQIDQAQKLGVDVEALMDNIKRTPAERIRRFQIVFDTVAELRNAKIL